MIYLEKPTDSRVDSQVVGCLVESNRDILQLLRAKDRKIEPRKWGCPAGRVEAGETPVSAMRRELREETGLIVAENQLLHKQRFFVRYPRFTFWYDLFVCRFLFKPEIVLSHEHVAFAWIPPAYASSLDLMEDELECINRVFGL